MSDVVSIKPPSVQFKPQGRGLAIVRGDQVQTVLTRDELPALVLAAARVLKG